MIDYAHAYGLAMEELPSVNEADRIAKALNIAVQHGGISGDHHKAWVIDQMVRVLAGDTYAQLVVDAKAGEDGPDTYDWNTGIAP